MPDDSPVVQVVTVLELPLLLLRNWTIPLVEEESWSRATATLYPLCAPLFLMFVTGTTTAKLGAMPAVVLVLLFGALFSLVLHLTTHESHPPTSFGLSFALLAVAFIMCAAWIYTIASELVAVIEAMGVLWHIPSSLLGLTLLAWGNSVGDLITNIAVARAGLSDMAIAGCFAGPTFNLLVGMGLSFLSKAAKVRTQFPRPRTIHVGRAKNVVTAAADASHAALVLILLLLSLPATDRWARSAWCWTSGPTSRSPSSTSASSSTSLSATTPPLRCGGSHALSTSHTNQRPDRHFRRPHQAVWTPQASASPHVPYISVWLPLRPSARSATSLRPSGTLCLLHDTAGKATEPQRSLPV